MPDNALRDHNILEREGRALRFALNGAPIASFADLPHWLSHDAARGELVGTPPADVDRLNLLAHTTSGASLRVLLDVARGTPVAQSANGAESAYVPRAQPSLSEQVEQEEKAKLSDALALLLQMVKSGKAA